jgi:hypothetical protein
MDDGLRNHSIEEVLEVTVRLGLLVVADSLTNNLSTLVVIDQFRPLMGLLFVYGEECVHNGFSLGLLSH